MLHRNSILVVLRLWSVQTGAYIYIYIYIYIHTCSIYYVQTTYAGADLYNMVRRTWYMHVRMYTVFSTVSQMIDLITTYFILACKSIDMFRSEWAIEVEVYVKAWAKWSFEQ
jgi:hypothetical protein